MIHMDGFWKMKTIHKNIPVYMPSITDLEKRYVSDCLQSSWISSRGPNIDKFEKLFSEKINVKYATTVSNGTVALHLAMMSLGIGPGDEVIVPTLTYIAPVNAIKYVGASPVFVDSLYSSWQINPDDVKRKITDKTKAVIAVHLYGQSCDMDQLVKLCKENNIFLIEDCAEAFGTIFNGKHVGTFGDIATFSFFGNKTITTGEGGMVVSNDKNLIDSCFHLKGQGLMPGRQYWHDAVGYNYRLTNIACSIGLAQLERSDYLINRKLKIAELYKDGFIDTEYEFHDQIENTIHSYWMCSILTPKSKERDKLMAHLKKYGIETRPVFYPIHTMPMYYSDERFPVAENISSRGINLPSYPDLTDQEVKFIIEKVLEY